VSALAGVRVVVTRAPHQNAEFAALLAEHGALPLLYPCIDIEPPADTTRLDEALQTLDTFHWLVLTSANTVIALAKRLDVLSIAVPARLKVAAVGRATAAAARDLLGVQTAALPDEFVAESLAQALGDVTSRQVFLPQSAIAETTLYDLLTHAGAKVMVITAYENVIGSGGVDLPALLAAGQVDVITFTSASTVNNLFVRLGSEGGDIRLLKTIPLACIGPKTAAAVHKHGLEPTIMPAEYTMDGLLTAIEHYFAGVENAR
jgi:uroporphyrinogen-III synthase